jgi:O-antigen ligase
MSKFSQNFFKKVLFFLIFWQLIAVYLMATAVWPLWVAWVNIALILVFILCTQAFEGLLLAVASIAFYVVLPQHYSDTLSMWRPVVGVLFLKAVWEWWSWFGPSLREGRLGGVRETSRGMTSTTTTSPSPSSWRRVNAAGGIISYVYNSFLLYEKIAIALLVLALVSLGLARYPLRGASQLIFLLSTLLVYFIVIWTVKNREQVVRLCTYAALSAGLIIFIGYIQFIATLFSSAYYFWQYWALRVASLYYGLPLAKVLQYSNSWVTVQGEEKTLRMFSIMTSSHAFAMVCVFFLIFSLPLLEAYTSRRIRRVLWTGVVLSCLALIISGTRGVWAGMVPALFVAGFLYYKKPFKALVSPVLASMLIVVVLFEASPLLDRTFAYIRSSGGEGTLDRVVSIVDVGETSNAGRLKMWKAASVYALHHPLGVGYANFVVTLTEDDSVSFDQAAGVENTLYRLPQRYITAHSLYLQILVELSALGLLLFGAFWMFLFQKVWMFLKKAGPVATFESVFLLTASIAFIWFLAYGVFDVTWLNDKILLYSFVVLGMSRVLFLTPSMSAEVLGGKK